MLDIKIPQEVLDEYNVCRGDSSGSIYHTFLSQTDYKITKLYEMLVMNPEEAEQIKKEFLDKNTELMHWRQVAREELRKSESSEEDA